MENKAVNEIELRYAFSHAPENLKCLITEYGSREQDEDRNIKSFTHNRIYLFYKGAFSVVLVNETEKGSTLEFIYEDASRDKLAEVICKYVKKKYSMEDYMKVVEYIYSNDKTFLKNFWFTDLNRFAKTRIEKEIADKLWVIETTKNIITATKSVSNYETYLTAKMALDELRDDYDKLVSKQKELTRFQRRINNC